MKLSQDTIFPLVSDVILEWRIMKLEGTCCKYEGWIEVVLSLALQCTIREYRDFEEMSSNVFLYLESNNVFNPCNEVHLFCLHLVYLDLINGALNEFCSEWNNHPVTTETNFSPQQLRVRGIVMQGNNSSSTAVQDVISHFLEYSSVAVSQKCYLSIKRWFR